VNRYSFFISDQQFNQQASTIKLKGKAIEDVRRLNSMQLSTIRCAFHLGKDLEAVAAMNKRAIEKGKMPKNRVKQFNLKAWVEEHLHEYISGSHACSIHALYCNLGQYTLFQHLSIPLRRLLRNTTKIYEYLQHHRSERVFWRAESVPKPMEV